jgi:hypothetical protein
MPDPSIVTTAAPRVSRAIPRLGGPGSRRSKQAGSQARARSHRTAIEIDWGKALFTRWRLQAARKGHGRLPLPSTTRHLLHPNGPSIGVPVRLCCRGDTPPCCNLPAFGKSPFCGLIPEFAKCRSLSLRSVAMRAHVSESPQSGQTENAGEAAPTGSRHRSTAATDAALRGVIQSLTTVDLQALPRLWRISEIAGPVAA